MVIVSLMTRGGDTSQKQVDVYPDSEQGTIDELRAWAAKNLGISKDDIRKVMVRVGDENEEDEDEIKKDRHIKPFIKNGVVIVVDLLVKTTDGVPLMDPATNDSQSYGKVRFYQGIRLMLDVYPEM